MHVASIVPVVVDRTWLIQQWSYNYCIISMHENSRQCWPLRLDSRLLLFPVCVIHHCCTWCLTKIDFPSCTQGLYSSVICPGLVMTNLTYGILPSFFWTLILPIMWLVSFRISALTIYLYQSAVEFSVGQKMVMKAWTNRWFRSMLSDIMI